MASEQLIANEHISTLWTYFDKQFNESRRAWGLKSRRIFYIQNNIGFKTYFVWSHEALLCKKSPILHLKYTLDQKYVQFLSTDSVRTLWVCSICALFEITAWAHKHTGWLLKICIKDDRQQKIHQIIFSRKSPWNVWR